MPPTEMSLVQLLDRIERDSAITRAQVQQALEEVRDRLNTFVTKDVWEAEKRLMEQRIERALSELAAQSARHERLKEQIAAEQAAQIQARRTDARDFIYKGLIPVLALLVAVVSLYLGSRGGRGEQRRPARAAARAADHTGPGGPAPAAAVRPGLGIRSRLRFRR